MISKKMMLVFAFVGVIFSLMSNGSLLAAEKGAFPTTLTYEGTKYVNCQSVPDYPFSTTQKTVTLQGKAAEKMGTRSFPWIGLSINEKLLFTAKEKKLVYCKEMVGKAIRVKGYAGTGEITQINFMTNKPVTQTVANAFFVTEITGWTYVSGYPVSEPSGTIAKEPSYFWVKTETLK